MPRLSGYLATQDLLNNAIATAELIHEMLCIAVAVRV